MNSNDIGTIIQYFRKQKGLTQRELAEAAGVGKTAVFDIEKGKATVQLDTLMKVLDVLNIQLKLKIPIL